MFDDEKKDFSNENKASRQLYYKASNSLRYAYACAIFTSRITSMIGYALPDDTLLKALSNAKAIDRLHNKGATSQTDAEKLNTLTRTVSQILSPHGISVLRPGVPDKPPLMAHRKGLKLSTKRSFAHDLNLIPIPGPLVVNLNTLYFPDVR